MNPIHRTDGLDLLYSLLAFLCEDELQNHPAIAGDVMAAFNIVAEHHVPDALLAHASGLAARDALHRSECCPTPWPSARPSSTNASACSASSISSAPHRQTCPRGRR